MHRGWTVDFFVSNISEEGETCCTYCTATIGKKYFKLTFICVRNSNFFTFISKRLFTFYLVFTWYFLLGISKRRIFRDTCYIVFLLNKIAFYKIVNYLLIVVSTFSRPPLSIVINMSLDSLHIFAYYNPCVPIFS